MGVRDLRTPLVGLAAWIGGLVGLLAPLWVGLLLTSLGLGCVWRAPASVRGALVGVLLAAVGVGVGAGFREASVAQGPVPDLADRRSAVQLRMTVTSDPVRLRGRLPGVRLRATVTRLQVAGTGHRVRAPVLVFGGPEWADVALGSEVAASGRLSRSRDSDLAALVTVRGSPELVRAPAPLWQASGRVRAEVRGAVADRAPPARDLVPALVMGDDAGLDEQVQADFRTTGMTHLLAVSGTNLTLVVGFLVVVGRWCGVRGWWQVALGFAGIVGFVLLARAEPSVVRAAAMGGVALLGLGSNGRDRGARALGLAVLVLLLWDPWLAVSVGFALSVLATGGILFLAPVWRDALARWMPGWLAAALAVPAAAQLVCTPVVAAISGQVSLVAVLANLVAGPLVAPATVCGLLGGLLGLVADPLGVPLGAVAVGCAAGIIAVARTCAGVSLPALDWGTGAVPLLVLTVLCAAVVVVAPRMLARPRPASGCAALLVVVVLVPLPSPGWPPRGWVVAFCDVGQGDAIALNAGHGAAVVVDAGPDPTLVDRCLDRLDVRSVPLLVLTHFHADHVDGLPGVYDGRRVSEVDVTGLAEPVGQAESVGEAAGETMRVPAYTESRSVGQVRLEVIGPVPGVSHHGSATDEGSGPNNASLVLVAEVRGVRILLTGDVEPEAQRVLAGSFPGLAVDVLKIPHHGSRHQEMDWLLSLAPRVAVASVGADNDYGHPAEETLGPLEATGTTVLRTDRDGDVVVVVSEGGISVIRSASRGRRWAVAG